MKRYIILYEQYDTTSATCEVIADSLDDCKEKFENKTACSWDHSIIDWHFEEIKTENLAQ